MKQVKQGDPLWACSILWTQSLFVNPKMCTKANEAGVRSRAICCKL